MTTVEKTQKPALATLDGKRADALQSALMDEHRDMPEIVGSASAFHKATLFLADCEDHEQNLRNQLEQAVTDTAKARAALISAHGEHAAILERMVPEMDRERVRQG